MTPVLKNNRFMMRLLVRHIAVLKDVHLIRNIIQMVLVMVMLMVRVVVQTQKNAHVFADVVGPIRAKQQTGEAKLIAKHLGQIAFSISEQMKTATVIVVMLQKNSQVLKTVTLRVPMLMQYVVLIVN